MPAGLAAFYAVGLILATRPSVMTLLIIRSYSISSDIFVHEIIPALVFCSHKNILDLILFSLCE